MSAGAGAVVMCTRRSDIGALGNSVFDSMPVVFIALFQKTLTL